MHLHWAELSLSGTDKECQYSPIGMRSTCAPGHSCSLLSLAYLRFDSCNLFISALELSIFVATSLIREVATMSSSV